MGRTLRAGLDGCHVIRMSSLTLSWWCFGQYLCIMYAAIPATLFLRFLILDPTEQAASQSGHLPGHGIHPPRGRTSGTSVEDIPLSLAVYLSRTGSAA